MRPLFYQDAATTPQSTINSLFSTSKGAALTSPPATPPIAAPAPIAAAASAAGLVEATEASSCDCWKRFEDEKAQVVKLIELEKHVDAVHLLANMTTYCPYHLLQNDCTLIEPLYRYVMIKRAYLLLGQAASAANLQLPPKKENNLTAQKQHQQQQQCSAAADAQTQQFNSNGFGSCSNNGAGRSNCSSSRGCSTSNKSNSKLCALRKYCILDETGGCACDIFRPAIAEAPPSLEVQAETAETETKTEAVDRRTAGTSAAAGEGRASYLPVGPAAAENSFKQECLDTASQQLGEQEYQCGEILHEGDNLLRTILKDSLLEKALREAEHPLVTGNQPSPWHKAVDDKQLEIFVRNYKDNKELLSFRIEGIIEAPLICCLSVLNEVDLFKQWVPYFTRPFKIGLRDVSSEPLGRVDRIVHFHVDFPWPFSNRDAYFEVWVVDDLDRNDHIVVKMNSLKPEEATIRRPQKIPFPPKGVERMFVDGTIFIFPRDMSSSFARVLWHENCGMHVPLKLVDFVSKIVARSAFNAFGRMCQQAATGVYLERRLQNRDLYDFIETRLLQHKLIDSTEQQQQQQEQKLQKNGAAATANFSSESFSTVPVGLSLSSDAFAASFLIKQDTQQQDKESRPCFPTPAVTAVDNCELLGLESGAEEYFDAIAEAGE